MLELERTPGEVAVKYSVIGASGGGGHPLLKPRQPFADDGG